MKFPFARELFPRVELTQRTIDDIDAKANALLSDTVERASRLLDHEHGLVNEHAWKKLKQLDSSLTLYRERHAGATGVRARSDTFAGRDKSLFAPPPPSFLLVGQVLCGLDDLMFGLSTATAEAQRIRSSYASDGVVDCQLLQELQAPTTAAPFQHRNLKWLAMTASNVPLTRPRDYVVLDEAGVVEALGPRVGYSLRHSVQLDDVAPLKQYKIVRGAMSMCGVFHEVYPSVVHLYVHMMFEPRARGAVNKSLATAAATEYAAAFSQIGHVATVKKLTAAVHATERSWKAPPSSQEAMDESDANPLATSYGSNATSVASSMGFRRTHVRREEPCGSCCQTIKAPTATEDIQDATCALCRQLLCRHCRDRKELSFVGRYNRVHRSKYTFCQDCLTHTATRSAAQIAVQELAHEELIVRTKDAARMTWGRPTTNYYDASMSPGSDEWR